MNETERAALATAYRTISDQGKERFDCEAFKALYRHFFGTEVTEDLLDHHLIGYAKHLDSRTLADYLRFLEYLDTHRRPKRGEIDP